MAAWAGLLLAGLLAATVARADSPEPASTSTDPDALLEAVRDEGRPPDDRQAAALVLIEHEAVEPVTLLESVLPLLTLDAPSPQREVGARLARQTSDELIDALIEMARDADAPQAMRQGAVLALGHQRERRVAEALVELTDPEEDEALRQAVFDSLATLTGRDDLGSDHAAWQGWWDGVAELSPQQWQQRLMQSLIRQRREARRHKQVLESRLVDAHRSLYRAVAIEQRPAQLMQLLEDPLEVVRQLGLDLAVQQLVDDQPFEEPLRQTLRRRLDDPSPAIRQRAALLLRDLADDAAADRVARRLAEGVEQDESVLRAELLMMSRLPRIEAVERALELLAHPALRDEAAAALNAAVDADRLTYQQGVRALQRVREQFDAGRPPSASTVLLLGRLGDEPDWQRIEGWLDAEDDVVKQAAARAWAESDRELLPLVERLEDSAIAAIALPAVARRADTASTFRALVAYEPEDETLREQWERALEEVAGRVASEAVLTAVDELQQGDASLGLCQRMLDAAVERAEASDRAEAARERVELLLARGRLHLTADDPEAALEDFDRLDRLDAELSEAQRERRERGVVRANLRLGEFDRAFEVAEAMLERTIEDEDEAEDGGAGDGDAERDEADVATDDGGGDGGERERSLTASDSPVDLLLDAAEQRAEAGDVAALEKLVRGLGSLPPSLGADLTQRLEVLEARLSRLRDEQAEQQPDDGEPVEAEADADGGGPA